MSRQTITINSLTSVTDGGHIIYLFEDYDRYIDNALLISQRQLSLAITFCLLSRPMFIRLSWTSWAAAWPAGFTIFIMLTTLNITVPGGFQFPAHRLSF